MLKLLLITSVLAAFGEDGHREAFERFKSAFEKKYESLAEEAERYIIFKKNRALIVDLNKENDSATFDVNAFADMTSEEFAASHLTGFRPSLQEQWKNVPHLGTHTYSGAKLPGAIDWVTKGAVTDVKNQGQCGSCWSFSATGSVEGAWEIATGKLVALSEQQLVDCSKMNNGCGGGLMDYAFKFMEKNALCTEEEYSYKAKKDDKCAAHGCTGIPKGGVAGFKDVDKDDANALKEAVSHGPVSIAIEADKQKFQFYKSGVLTAQCGSQLDHGVLLVGYGTEKGLDYWKVKNSWGPAWGDAGYIKLERGKVKDGAGGECGLMSQPSYPVVKAATEIMV